MFHYLSQQLHFLIDLVFFLAVAGTILGSVWLSRKYKERYAEFPWMKAVLIIIAEVIAWIIFHTLWHHPLILVITAVVIIIIYLKKKKQEERIL